jgi:filamentous hemagglutinin family protein
VSAPITLPGGQTQLNITGGTRPGGGLNLYHSFGNFNVPNNNIANFLNNCGLPTSNILGRVTGGNISSIFGTIQTTGFGNANLFLMNPAGFLFGPNATLNVGGMVAFTSADYIRLADDARFNAVTGSADALLTAAPVAAFGFLGSNPGAITVQGTQLTVSQGTGISIVGGNITVQSGTLNALTGQINLVSVGRASNPKVGGEVVVAGSGQGSGFTPTGFATLGTISLSQGSVISVRARTPTPAGSVVIRGTQLVINDTDIFAAGDVTRTSGGSITLDSSGGLDIQNSQLFINNEFGPSGGKIDLTAGSSINLTDTLVNAHGYAFASSINMEAPIISLRGSTIIASADVYPGSISLNAKKSVTLSDVSLIALSEFLVGGTIVINGGKQFTAQQSQLDVRSFFGDGGTITVQATRIGLTDSMLTTVGPFHGGHISLSAKQTSITNSQILSPAQEGQGGTIDITTKALHRDTGSVIDASSQSGTDGTVTINGVVQP